MTVGTVIFLFVALALQLEIIFDAINRYGDIDLLIRHNDAKEFKTVGLYASDCDPFLYEYSDYIEDWGYVTN